jgi:hypothetical protein
MFVEKTTVENLAAFDGGLMRLTALGGAIVLASLQVSAQTAQTDVDKSHNVINLENAWNQAEKLHDLDALKLLLADTFVDTDDDGSFMGRDEWLRKVQSAAADYESLTDLERSANVYGNTVVVTGIYVEKMRITGKTVEQRGRFTDTWIFQNNHWECVASHSTLVR